MKFSEHVQSSETRNEGEEDEEYTWEKEAGDKTAKWMAEEDRKKQVI